MNQSIAGIIEEKGKYLVGKRKNKGAIGGFWEFPGGKVEENETPEEALVREFKEELDIEVASAKRLCESGFSNKGKDYKLIAIQAIRLDKTDFLLNEHDEIKWASPAEILQMNMAPSDKKLLPLLFKAEKQLY